MLLSVSKLNKSYGEVEALREIALEVAEGEFVSIVGPSGCGKSTLMRCMAGLEPISSGRLTLRLQPVVRPPGQPLRGTSTKTTNCSPRSMKAPPRKNRRNSSKK